MKAPLMKAMNGAPKPSIFPTISSFDRKALDMYTRDNEKGNIVKAMKNPKNMFPTGLNPSIKLDKNKIIIETLKLLSDNQKYNEMTKAKNPYGDGKACERIVNIIGDF